MMAKGPTQRYQTPAEVALALTPFLPSSRRRGGIRLFMLAAAICALALFAGAVLSFWTGNRSPLARGEKERNQEERVAGGPAQAIAAPRKRRPARGDGVPARYRPAIDKGLAYLARTQHNDGHWEAIGGQYPTAITALAGMALLMEGSTIGEGRHAGSIRKAVDWLIKRSKPNGLLDPAPKDGGRYMFGHGFAMFFLSTVYGQEEDGERRDKLEKILTKAVEFTSNAQVVRGGWGYVTAADGNNLHESASTIAQLQGLRAARNSGIVVPKQLFDMDYLRQCTTPRGGVIYSLTIADKNERPALTAAALACMLTGGEYDSDLARKWLKFCQQSIPFDKPDVRIGHDEYTHYYYAQALYILGDKGYEKLFPSSKPDERLTWSKYRESLFATLLARQGEDGGWHSADSVTSRTIGPVYTTAVSLTILQLDKAMLPIYRR
jgi:hypothetical protein